MEPSQFWTLEQATVDNYIPDAQELAELEEWEKIDGKMPT